jgi:hypothetical protein
MARNFCGIATQAPSRGRPFTAGGRRVSTLRSAASVVGDSAAPLILLTREGKH